MTAKNESIPTEKLIERFDRGADLVDYNRDMVIMDSVSGPMKVSSIRLPEVFLRAMDNIENESTDRSSIVRSAIYQWFSKNNPDALRKAIREIETEIKQDQEQQKASA